jgi:hypothetical protein
MARNEEYTPLYPFTGIVRERLNLSVTVTGFTYYRSYDEAYHFDSGGRPHPTTNMRLQNENIQKCPC